MAIEDPEQWVNERSRLSHQYGMVLPTDDLWPLVDEVKRQREVIAELVAALRTATKLVRLCGGEISAADFDAVLAKHGGAS